MKSRYLQYDKKENKKDSSANSFTTSTAKPSEKGRSLQSRSVLPQKCKTSAGAVTRSLNQSSFEKGDLQSTLLGEDKITRPDLDLSAINDKSLLKKTPSSKSVCKTGTRTSGKERNAVSLTALS